MIQDSRNELTLIVYDSPTPPRYFRVNKKILKFILFILGIFVILSITGAILVAPYIKKLQSKQGVSKQIQQQLKELENEVIYLKKEKMALIEKNAALKVVQVENQPPKAPEVVTSVKNEQELNGQKAQTSTLPKPEDLLDYFKRPQLAKSLISQNIAQIQRVHFKVESDKAVLKFNLANGDTMAKLRGYIFVTQFSSNSVKFYPHIELTENNFTIDYHLGESFTVSRFRPTEAIFDLPEQDRQIFYKIIVFTREGDLLIEEYHGPFSAN